MSISGEARARGHYRALGGSSAERGFTAAFELVATPALFGLIGYFLDRWLGTGPFLTIGLAAFVAGYCIWKLWYQYTRQMEGLEADLIASRSGGGASQASTRTDEARP